jgi:hypothetical protein
MQILHACWTCGQLETGVIGQADQKGVADWLFAMLYLLQIQACSAADTPDHAERS